MRLTFHWTFAVFNHQKSHFTRIFFWKTGRKDKRKEKTPAYLLVHLSRLLLSILYTKSISIFKLSFHSEYKRVSKRLDAKHKPTKRTSAYLLLLHMFVFSTEGWLWIVYLLFWKTAYTKPTKRGVPAYLLLLQMLFSTGILVFISTGIW
jgi:hypothetical protein